MLTQNSLIFSSKKEKTLSKGSAYAKWLRDIIALKPNNAQQIYLLLSSVTNFAGKKYYLPDFLENVLGKWFKRPSNLPDEDGRISFAVTCFDHLYRNDTYNFKKYITIPNKLIDLVIKHRDNAEKGISNFSASAVVGEYKIPSDADPIYFQYANNQKIANVDEKKSNIPCTAAETSCEASLKADIIYKLYHEKGFSLEQIAAMKLI